MILRRKYHTHHKTTFMKIAKTNSLPGMHKTPATSQSKDMTDGKMTQSFTRSADDELEALLDSDEDKILHLHDQTVEEEKQDAYNKRR
jgi:hypothetical protein